MKLDLYFAFLIASMRLVDDLEALVLFLNSALVPPTKAVEITFC